MPMVVSSGRGHPVDRSSESVGAPRPEGVDDEVGRHRLAGAVLVLRAHAGDHRPIGRCQHFHDPAALSQCDIGLALDPPSQRALDRWP